MLSAKNLHITFNAGTPIETRALRGLSLDIPTGQFVTVASLSGNQKGRMLSKDGKLTVVRINHTATKLQDGRVLILGRASEASG